MSSSDDSISRLVKWSHQNLGRLRHEPARVVADQLGDEILRIDGQLGVEVADDEAGTREIIITAFSEPKLFPLVRRVVALLANVPGWRFTALKPPRGFAFELRVGDHKLPAKTLAFAPIPDIYAGIQLVAPRSAISALRGGAEAEELAWLVVETGIGEELAGALQHVEFCTEEDVLEIEELGAYVGARWRTQEHPEPHP